MRVRWLSAALRNLDEITNYLARDNPGAAAAVLDRIFASVDPVSQFPEIGRAGRVPGTRELVVRGTPYIVPYRVREQHVEILRVFHAARRWPTEF